MNYAEALSANENALAARADVHAGDLTIRPSRLSISGPAGTVKIEPKGMLVLLLMTDAGGETVSRETIYTHIWGGVFVGEDSLNRAIHITRRALRDSGSAARIETIPRLGYRLTGTEPAAPSEIGLPHVSSQKSPGINRRVAMGGLAAAAIAGTAGWALWRRSREAEAHELVADARRRLRSEAPGQSDVAVRYLRRATAIAPDHAPGWGLLAHAFARVESPPGGAAEAEFAAGRALAIDAREPLARLALANLRAGLVNWHVTEGEFRRILAEHDRTIEVMDSLGFFLQGVGHGDESWRLIERAAAIDPFAAGPHYKRAIKLWIAGRQEESDRVADRAMQLWPGHPWVWNARFMTLMFSGREGAARAMLADRKSQPESIAAPALATWRAGLGALENPSPSNVAKARDAYFQAAPRSPGVAVHGIMTMSALGALDAAYDIMELLLFNGGPLAGPAAKLKSKMLLSDVSWRQTQWLFTPPLGPVRDDARFAGLTERTGLDAYWRKTGRGPDPVRAWHRA